MAALVTGLLLVAGCASYAPQPLAGDDIEAVLASPDRAVLIGAAAQRRPEAIKLDFSQPLTAEQLGVIAVLSNPDLRAQRLQLKIADAQVFAAGLLPDPQLSLGLDRVLAPRSAGLAAGLAAGLSVDLLGALATRAVEHETRQAAREQVRLDLAWQEWAIAGEARLLAERWPRQQAAADLARQSAELSDRALARTLVAAARGDLKADEITAQRLATSDADARALATERDAETSRLDLNRLLGLRPEEIVQLAPPPQLPDWQPPDVTRLFETARASRLDIAALAKGYDSQQAALHRAVLGQYPRLAITLNRQRDTSRVHTFGPALSLDLPLWNRNRGEIALARLDRERLRAEYAARLFQTRADIAGLVAALNQDEAARSLLKAQLPPLSAIAANIEAAAARGDLTQPQAEAARAAFTDKQLAWLALDQACAEQRLALALAVGAPLPQDLASAAARPDTETP